MILLIDGYNLLKQVFYKERDALEKKREAFIRDLGIYFQKKKDLIKKIIVVFDAGPFFHASREKNDGIFIAYSGQRSTADRWIIQFSEKNKNAEIMLVTMDRELVKRCESMGVEHLPVNEFYTILQNALSEKREEGEVFSEHEKKFLHKGEEEKLLKEDVDQESLDQLMRRYSDDVYNKNDVYEKKSAHGSSHTLSKKDRKKWTKIKKLL